MNAVSHLRELLSSFRLIGDTPDRSHSFLAWSLRTTGILVLVGGLQTWEFNRYTSPLIGKAKQELVLLQEEVAGSKLIDATLSGLRDYWRISDDVVRKRQIMELRDALMQHFRDDPRVVIEDAVRIASGFDANSDIERERLLSLQQHLARLQEVYSDHYAAAISAYTDAPLHLQPTAALLSSKRSGMEALSFNHALYLMLVGDRSTANSIYTDLRHNTRSGEFESRVLYAQARIQYDAFEIEKNPEYFLQAVQYAQQSLQSDATYELAKLFLEYLLSIDQQAMQVESAPEEGQGSGESDGERGAISTGSREH